MENGALDVFDKLMAVADVVDDGMLNGHGTGNEIVSAMAALLNNGQSYGFKFKFWRKDDPSDREPN